MRTCLLVTLLSALALAACGDDDRPDVGEWSSTWSTTQESAREATSMLPLDRPSCERLLAVARTEAPELVPAPDLRLDELVETWIATAEAIGLDCEHHPDLDGALDELADTESEIATHVDSLGS